MKPESQRDVVINRRLRSVERYTDALDLSMGDLIERMRTLEQRVRDLESPPYQSPANKRHRR